MPYGAEYLDTSAYLAGTCAVGLWFLEAAGSTYDWTIAERDETLAGIWDAWDRLTVHGGDAAFLTFEEDYRGFVPVTGVPILSTAQNSTWINQALANAGWSGSTPFERCFAYNNFIRNYEETNWCFSIFIVDSDPNISNGLFADGLAGWGYYGGPWMYMSREASIECWPDYFTALPMHEIGHIFWATDEYDGMIEWNGYLNRPDDASTSVLCLMNECTGYRICPDSRNQLGWRDADDDGVIDPLDVDPAVTLNVVPERTCGAVVSWTWIGNATVGALPNATPHDYPYVPQHDITLVHITSVDCRIDGGPWSAATARDGTFGGYVEPFEWTTGSLASGAHMLDVRVLDSAGNTTTATAEVTAGPAVWRVAQDGSGDVTTIQAALALSSCGDTLSVVSGTYYEHDLDMKAGVTLKGVADYGPVVIDALQQGRCIVVDGLDPSTRIEGVTFRGGRVVGTGIEAGGGGMACGGSCTVVNCVFSLNEAQWGGGMQSYAVVGVRQSFIDCSFIGNTAVGHGGGVANWSTDLTLQGCVFSGNTAGGAGGGLYAAITPSPVESCTFSGNVAGWGGGMALDTYSGTLQSCTLSGI